jgi:hypothetical protein
MNGCPKLLKSAAGSKSISTVLPQITTIDKKVKDVVKTDIFKILA